MLHSNVSLWRDPVDMEWSEGRGIRGGIEMEILIVELAILGERGRSKLRVHAFSRIFPHEESP